MAIKYIPQFKELLNIILYIDSFFVNLQSTLRCVLALSEGDGCKKVFFSVKSQKLKPTCAEP